MALKNSPTNKALGPDGMNAGNFRKFWSIIRLELLEYIITTKRDEYFFIFLISKVETPNVLKNYRPISLINMGMKLIKKWL